MDVAIAGGHGQIALLLTRRLADDEHRVRGLIRNADHADDLREAGAEPVVCDLEEAGAEQVAEAIAGADAVVFAAGAGPGSGAARKGTMDRDGAVKLLEAARAAGVDRYIMVSAMGAADPPGGDEVFAVYLRAKADADRALAQSDRAWTIVRPGLLTDDPGTGRVQAGPSVPRGPIPRDDVAAVLAAVLGDAGTAGATFEVVSGDVPVAEAVATAARAG
ncbi:MAG: SDR family oxidoreductase [Solirubrobacterales bacterium]|nr:SDR family oxidoreductase [Solirubrobacterales bacterium]